MLHDALPDAREQARELAATLEELEAAVQAARQQAKAAEAVLEEMRPHVAALTQLLSAPLAAPTGNRPATCCSPATSLQAAAVGNHHLAALTALLPLPSRPDTPGYWWHPQQAPVQSLKPNSKRASAAGPAADLASQLAQKYSQPQIAAEAEIQRLRELLAASQAELVQAQAISRALAGPKGHYACGDKVPIYVHCA